METAAPWECCPAAEAFFKTFLVESYERISKGGLSV